MIPHREIAPAKLNLALHVRGKRPDGRHDIETIFAFCTDGDRLSGEEADDLSLDIGGPFAAEIGSGDDNLVLRAARALQAEAGVRKGAAIRLDKRLPVAAGIGGGSADAAATLRLLTAMWGIGPEHAVRVAPAIGSDVPACLLSLPAKGVGAGDELSPVDLSDLSGTAVLLINPRMPVSTAEAFARWNGNDRGPLDDWRTGRNDLEEPALALAPLVTTVLAWLSAQRGATVTRMSGSGATCFALFDSEAERDASATAVPREWWQLATSLR